MEIEHITCDICNQNITEKISDTEAYGMVFNIEREAESYSINEDGTLDFEDGNQKMIQRICENCFLKILNESKTLGDLFLVKDRTGKSEDKFIY